MAEATAHIIDTIRDNANSIAERDAAFAERNANVSDLIMGSSFNAAAALPEGFERSYGRALVGADRYGDFSFTNGSGVVRTLNGNDYDARGNRLDKSDNDEGEEFSAAFEGHAQEQKRERERREWSETKHSYAGRTMTGTEWGELSDLLSGDSDLRRRLVDHIKAKGKTQADADKAADQVALLARMQSLPKDQWTQEMRDLKSTLDQNPEKREELDGYLQKAADLKAQTLSKGNAVERDTTNGTRSTSVVAAADLLDSPIQGAPALQEEYKAALAATEPLDAEKPPIKIAAVTPQIAPLASPGGGFDG